VRTKSWVSGATKLVVKNNQDSAKPSRMNSPNIEAMVNKVTDPKPIKVSNPCHPADIAGALTSNDGAHTKKDAAQLSEINESMKYTTHTISNQSRPDTTVSQNKKVTKRVNVKFLPSDLQKIKCRALRDLHIGNLLINLIR